jgi:hypothetical protein
MGDSDSLDVDPARDATGSTRCDERMEEFVSRHCPLRVESVSADEARGFSLALEGGFHFEVFPDDSLDDERWRLFQPSKDLPHIVFEKGRLVEDEPAPRERKPPSQGGPRMRRERRLAPSGRGTPWEVEGGLEGELRAELALEVERARHCRSVR